MGAQLVAPLAIKMGMLGVTSWVSRVAGSSVHISTCWSVVSWVAQAIRHEEQLLQLWQPHWSLPKPPTLILLVCLSMHVSLATRGATQKDWG